MAQETKAQKAFVAQKNRDRDREVSERGAAGAGIEKHGYGGMDTKQRPKDTGKKGI